MKKTKSPWPDRIKEIYPSLKHDQLARRKMMIAALEFLDAEGKADRRFGSHEELAKLVAADHTALESLRSSMRAAAPGQTPAIIGQILEEVLKIKLIGWEKYHYFVKNLNDAKSAAQA